MDIQSELDTAQLKFLQLLLEADCKFLFKTYLPQGGWAAPKPYVMMKDTEGGIFLERIPENHA